MFSRRTSSSIATALLSAVVCLVFLLVVTPSTTQGETTEYFKFNDFALGSSFVCSITEYNGKVLCWGGTDLGDLNNVPSYNGTYKSVAAGNAHACAIKSDDTVVCWGSTTASSSDRPEITGPNAYTGKVKAVATGYDHTCVIKSDETVACFSPRANDIAIPVDVTTVSAISAGTDYTCVIRKTQGDIKCWGTVLSEMPQETNMVSLSAGGQHACALNSTGSAFCWGLDTEIVLEPNGYAGPILSISAGIGSTCLIDDTTKEGFCYGTTALPDTLNSPTYLSLKTSTDFSCGIIDNSTMVCGGSNTYGQTAIPLPSTCGGVSQTDPTVCSTHGYCHSNGTCMCNDGFGGDTCSLFTCFGYDQNNNLACNGHGNCTAVDVCQCADGYTGHDCEQLSCFGLGEADGAVCSGRGVCDGPNYCACFSEYYGSECELFDCYDHLFNSSQACSNHGTCIDYNNCTCDTSHGGHNCSLPKCYGVLAGASGVCSGHGSCDAPDMCTCIDGFYGSKCNLPYPVASIVASEYVSSCGDIRIDGSQSYTTVGTKLTYLWSSIYLANATIAQNLNNYLNTQNKPIISVPVNYLPPSGGVVTVQLIVKNQDDQTSHAVTTSVSFSNTVTKSISANIIGAAVQTTMRSRGITLSGYASFPTCLTQRPTLTYTWKEGSATVGTGPDLVFGSNSLVAGTHTYQLVISNSADANVASAEVTVEVTSSKLVAVIAGGDRLVARSSAVELDASGSYDPDKAGEPTQFAWSCTGSCSSLQALLSTTTTGKLAIPANTLTNSASYSLCVTYSTVSRSSKTCTSLQVSSGTVSIIDVSMTKTNPVITRKPRVGSLPDSVRFETTIASAYSAATDVTCTWALDGTTVTSSNGVATRNSLALFTESLVEGKTYTLRFKCDKSDSTASGWASTEFTVNTPPSSGSAIADASTGSEMTTLFSFAATQWTDADLPLSYSWTATDANNVKLFTTSASAQNSLSTVLPAGTITLTVTVTDSLGASSTATTSVTVTAASQTGTALISLLDSTLDNLFFDVNSGGVSSARNLLVLSDIIMSKLASLNSARRSITDAASLVDRLVGLVSSTYAGIGSAEVDTTLYEQISTSVYNFATYQTVSTNAQGTLFTLSKDLISRSNTQNVNFAQLMSTLVGALNALASKDNAKLKQLPDIIANLQVLIGRGINGYGEQEFSSDDLNMLVGRYYTGSIDSAISIPLGDDSQITVQLTSDGKNLLVSQTSGGDAWFYSHIYNYTQLVESGAITSDNTENSNVVSPVITVEVVPGSYDANALSSFDDKTFFTMVIPASTATNSIVECKYLSGTGWSTEGCTVSARTASTVTCSCTHMSQFMVTEQPVRVNKKSSNAVAVGVGIGVGLGIPLLLIVLLVVVVVVALLVYLLRTRSNKFTNRKELTDLELQNVMYRDDHI